LPSIQPKKICLLRRGIFYLAGGPFIPESGQSSGNICFVPPADVRLFRLIFSHAVPGRAAFSLNAVEEGILFLKVQHQEEGMDTLKLLHIGRDENLGRYTEKTGFTESIRKVCMPMGLPAEAYIRQCPDADILIADAIADIPADLMQGMPELKLIHSEGVAFNRIDIETAGRQGIYVCNCAGMNAQAVAEQAILLMLGVLRNVAYNDQAVRDGRQIQVKEGYMAAGTLRDLSDCTVGLIGCGNIGRCTAKLLKAFHAETYYSQRRRLDADEEQGRSDT